MRNSEIVELIETVNNVLQREKCSDTELAMLARWAQMGVDETGGTPYRVALILARQVADARDGLAKLIAAATDETLQKAVEAKEADKAAADTPAGVNLGEPVRQFAPVDDDDFEPVDDGMDDAPLEEEPEFDAPQSLAGVSPQSW